MQADVSLPSKIFISAILQLKRVPSLIFQHTRGFYCFVRYFSLHLSITITPASFLESSQLHNNLTVGFPSIFPIPDLLMWSEVGFDFILIYRETVSLLFD